MRVLTWFFIATTACGPKHTPSPHDESELPTPQRADTDRQPAGTRAAEPPPRKGARNGTIERPKLVAVLNKGPGAFLGQFEVSPRLEAKRFIGWQLVRLLDRNSPLTAIDVAPGDVLASVNGNSLSRPDQLQTLWDSLRTANSIQAVLWRGATKVDLAFAIEPHVGR